MPAAPAPAAEEPNAHFIRRRIASYKGWREVGAAAHKISWEAKESVDAEEPEALGKNAVYGAVQACVFPASNWDERTWGTTKYAPLKKQPKGKAKKLFLLDDKDIIDLCYVENKPRMMPGTYQNVTSKEHLCTQLERRAWEKYGGPKGFKQALAVDKVKKDAAKKKKAKERREKLKVQQTANAPGAGAPPVANANPRVRPADAPIPVPQRVNAVAGPSRIVDADSDWEQDWRSPTPDPFEDHELQRVLAIGRAPVRAPIASKSNATPNSSKTKASVSVPVRAIPKSTGRIFATTQAGPSSPTRKDKKDAEKSLRKKPAGTSNESEWNFVFPSTRMHVPDSDNDVPPATPSPSKTLKSTSLRKNALFVRGPSDSDSDFPSSPICTPSSSSRASPCKTPAPRSASDGAGRKRMREVSDHSEAEVISYAPKKSEKGAFSPSKGKMKEEASAPVRATPKARTAGPSTSTPARPRAVVGAGHSRQKQPATANASEEWDLVFPSTPMHAPDSDDVPLTPSPSGITDNKFLRSGSLHKKAVALDAPSRNSDSDSDFPSSPTRAPSSSRAAPAKTPAPKSSPQKRARDASASDSDEVEVVSYTPSPKKTKSNGASPRNTESRFPASPFRPGPVTPTKQKFKSKASEDVIESISNAGGVTLMSKTVSPAKSASASPRKRRKLNANPPKDDIEVIEISD